MSFEPRDYLRHIQVEADYLIGRSEGVSFDAFSGDETLRRAFVRSLEIIGEAAKKVPEDFRARHPSVEWRAIAGMRDRLIPRLLRRRLRVGLGRGSSANSRVAQHDHDHSQGLTSGRI